MHPVQDMGSFISILSFLFGLLNLPSLSYPHPSGLGCFYLGFSVLQPPLDVVERKGLTRVRPCVRQGGSREFSPLYKPEHVVRQEGAKYQLGPQQPLPCPEGPRNSLFIISMPDILLMAALTNGPMTFDQILSFSSLKSNETVSRPVGSCSLASYSRTRNQRVRPRAAECFQHAIEQGAPSSNCSKALAWSVATQCHLVFLSKVFNGVCPTAPSNNSHTQKAHHTVPVRCEPGSVLL